MYFALGLFLITYVLLLIFSKYRAYIAFGSAILFVLFGILPVEDVFGAIDWNVLMMIGGTMATVDLFIESGMPALMADMLMEKVPNVKWTIVALALFAGIVSAFIDNVATVLMIAPVALALSKKLNISAVPIIIAISVSSNLQGAATLVGDTTSILLGGHANMNFMDFFFYEGKPGLFWIVQCGAIVSALVLLIQFRKYTQPVTTDTRTVVRDYVPSFLLAGTVLSLIAVSFIPNKPAITNGLICVGLALVGYIRKMIISKNVQASLKQMISAIDVQTLLLLASLFVIIAGITEAGVIDAIANLFVAIGNDNLFLIYTIIVWASVFFSAFIDNIPYVATMLPVVGNIAALMGVSPTVLYFGLLIGSTLGGNFTPIGASANITGIGILRKNGYEVKNSDFMKIGIPFSLIAVLSGYILTWVLFA